MKMTQSKYDTHLEANDGYCSTCEMVTADEVEPEAQHQECPECGEHTVYGMEAAVMYEQVEIIDGDSDDEDEDFGIISLSDDDGE